ncbi:kynurenine formamidase [Frankliniella occidentalis]|uniref:Kynurenine formamidase n=1 Tax=Frankliniella occidentalis TaxID=133901 RepID=A0A6J1SZN1_FRAOC|nr:kynurenine formamidase [Frankliniella occidentalis]
MPPSAVFWLLLVALCPCLALSLPATGGGSTDQPFTGPVDLTHALNARAQNWPGARGFNFTLQVAQDEPWAGGGWIAFNEFCMAEHLGTHIDAPFHFNKTGWKLHEIPIDRFIAPGVLIDASAAAAANPDTFLGADALEDWEAQHGRVAAGSVVLVRFGWADKYADRRAYFGVATDDRASNDTEHLSFPSLSPELARALADRLVAGVGVDTPSVDPGKAGDHKPFAHRALAAVNAFNLENVDLRTTVLPPKGFTLIVLPAKIEDGTGGPVRVVAVPGDRPWA